MSPTATKWKRGLKPATTFLQTLELQPHLERALTRRLERASTDVVDESKSTGEEAIRRVFGCRRSETGCGRVLHFRTVEDVLEVHAILEAIERRQAARAEALAREHAQLSLRNLEISLGDEEIRDFVPGSPLIQV